MLPQAWDLSCPDWVDRLKAGKSLVPDLPNLFRDEAERAVAIFDRLRFPDLENTPTLKEAVGDWFRDIVRALFGSYDRELQHRYIREAFLLVPKKNSKSSNGAELMLTALLMNRRPLAKFIMTAPTQDITDLAFSQAAGAVELDPVLKKKLHVREHVKTIEHRVTGATLEIMTFDPATLTGQKPAGVLIDEIHVLAKMAKAASAIRQLRGGFMAMPEQFIVFTTTQSEEEPTGVFLTELTKARAIRDGRAKGTMLPVLYEFPKELQEKQEFWLNPDNWGMVTPNMGRSITLPRLLEGYDDATLKGIGEVRVWASQHLNIQVGVGIRGDGWPGALFWEDAIDETLLDLGELLRRSDVVTVGVDGGGLDDLTGFAILGREKETRRWLLWTKAWVHKSVLKLRQEIAPRLQAFEKAGELVIIDDNKDTDRKEIGATIERIEALGLLPDKHAIGIDPAGTTLIGDELSRRGFAIDVGDGTGGRVVGIRQGAYSLNGVVKTAELRLAARELVHGGTTLMNWCVTNAQPVKRGNATSIEKEHAGGAKIDPLMATFNAVALMIRNPSAAGKSIYEDDDRFSREFGAGEAEADDTASADRANRTDWNPEILKDIDHPDFAEHRARFERWQDLNDSDED
jgi:phage terminase large subunit-like protein